MKLNAILRKASVYGRNVGHHRNGTKLVKSEVGWRERTILVNFKIGTLKCLVGYEGNKSCM